MKAAMWLVLMLLLPAVVSAQPAAPGAACSPVSDERDSSALDVAPDRPVVVSENQALTVSWTPVSSAAANASVAGYRVIVFDGQTERAFETSSGECRVSAVNGRVYAVQVAVVWDDGTMGPASPAATGQPVFAQDFALLAAGLAVIWLGVWLYAFMLVRQQRRLMDRYEGLFKKGESGGDP